MSAIKTALLAAEKTGALVTQLAERNPRSG